MPPRTVIGVIAYLFLIAFLLLYGVGYLAMVPLPPTVIQFRVGLTASFIGGLGGCVYCLRGVYLNYAVKRQWGNEWIVWYFLRPLVSTGCGAVSYLFLRAGLLVLEATRRDDATEIGFYALAFIAGLNVDRFLAKIEDIAKAVWGIEPSRTARPPPPE